MGAQQYSNESVEPVTGLILSGGGARAAYQVGVLKAIADMLPHDVHNPFPVICGTSAGAINATGIATHATRFQTGIRGMEAVWRDFHAHQVYRTEFSRLSAGALRWLLAMFSTRLSARHPISLLDNQPLADLLGRVVHFEHIAEAIEAGELQALGITAFGYSSSDSVTFFQGTKDLKGWRRERRVGVPVKLGLRHLLASSSIPALFPPARIDREYFGDGSLRQLAPVSPALHLGADKVLVVGVGEEMAYPRPTWEGYDRPPSPAQIAGHVLDSAFFDGLDGDLERLRRINHTLSLMPAEIHRRPDLRLRQVDVLTILPSQSISAIAARHADELPRSLRFFLRGSSATESAGSTLISYLLFEQGYCRELISLGYADALKRKNEVLRFLGYAAGHGQTGVSRRVAHTAHK